MREEYLNTAFGEVETHYGTVEDYVRDGMGVPQASIDALRARLLEG
ncbi:tyrosine-protein phosphatase [Yinghuangia aomiensis]